MTKKNTSEKKKKKKHPSASALPDVPSDALAQSQPEKKAPENTEKKKRSAENAEMDTLAVKKMRRKSAPNMDAVNNSRKAARSVSEKKAAKILTKSKTTKQESDHS